MTVKHASYVFEEWVCNLNILVFDNILWPFRMLNMKEEVMVGEGVVMSECIDLCRGEQSAGRLQQVCSCTGEHHESRVPGRCCLSACTKPQHCAAFRVSVGLWAVFVCWLCLAALDCTTFQTPSSFPDKLWGDGELHCITLTVPLDRLWPVTVRNIDAAAAAIMCRPGQW